MNLKARLLFSFIPLLLLSLVFATLVAFFLAGKVAPPAVIRPYIYPAVGFIILIAATAIVIIVSVAHTVSKPLQLLTGVARTISEGNLDISVELEEGVGEVDHLSRAINQMKTDLKRQQETIQKQAAEAAVGQMASHVAHDLASPLSSMQTALEFFRGLKASDAKAPDYLNLLELSALRLKGISKELLDHHKGRGPKKILFSLPKLLDELIGEYQSQPQFECVEIVKRHHPENIVLYGDRGKLQRVFGNLIKNAVEAMDKCGTLTVATRVSEGMAHIDVQDTGCGMAPEVLEKVLAGGFSKGKADGHGIGTVVVQKTLQEHGGKLFAESEVGVGTTFQARLPLPESVQIRGAEREEETVETFAIASKKGEPVIVIDDDPSFLEQWRLVLEREGRTALLCSSWEDFAGQKITRKLSATAVVDYHFENSELNGIEVIGKLKEAGFEHLYLCTVEYWKPSLKKQAEELGVKICPKPLPKISVTTFPLLSLPSEALAKEGKEGSGEVKALPKERKDYKVIVIDDDVMIRMGWELGTGKLGIEKLHAFESLEKLMAAELDLGGIDLAFVDKNIEGSRHSGAECIAYLKQRGIKKVVLASGEDSKALREDPNFAKADFIINEKIPASFLKFYS